MIRKKVCHFEKRALFVAIVPQEYRLVPFFSECRKKLAKWYPLYEYYFGAPVIHKHDKEKMQLDVGMSPPAYIIKIDPKYMYSLRNLIFS